MVTVDDRVPLLSQGKSLQSERSRNITDAETTVAASHNTTTNTNPPYMNRVTMLPSQKFVMTAFMWSATPKPRPSEGHLSARLCSSYCRGDESAIHADDSFLGSEMLRPRTQCVCSDSPQPFGGRFRAWFSIGCFRVTGNRVSPVACDGKGCENRRIFRLQATGLSVTQV